MKYLSSIVMAAILLTASSAIAQDWTYLGALQAHQSQPKEFKLTDSKSTIEVYGGSYSVISNTYDDISCKFIDYDGTVVSEQKHVARCFVNTKPLDVVPWRISVVVTNEESKPITYKIWVHETK